MSPSDPRGHQSISLRPQAAGPGAVWNTPVSKVETKEHGGPRTSSSSPEPEVKTRHPSSPSSPDSESEVVKPCHVPRRRGMDTRLGDLRHLQITGCRLPSRGSPFISLSSLSPACAMACSRPPPTAAHWAQRACRQLEASNLL